MDIFNKKRVEELERELKKLKTVEEENKQLRNQLDKAERELKKLKTVEEENKQLRNQLDKAVLDLRCVTELKQAIPDDCTPGTYCTACEFGKECSRNYHVYTGGYGESCNSTVSFCICTKGETCTNFIQKEVKE